MSHAGKEILQRKSELGRELCATLYFLPEKTIVTPVYVNDAGIHYEQDTPIMIDRPLSSDELGKLAVAALITFAIKDRNLRDTKKTDWPSFKVSGIKSVRAFESAAIRLSVGTVNANLQIRGWPSADDAIHVATCAAPAVQHSELGRLIMQVVACCQKLRTDEL